MQREIGIESKERDGDKDIQRHMENRDTEIDVNREMQRETAIKIQRETMIKWCRKRRG